jgi:hypothetical protein
MITGDVFIGGKDSIVEYVLIGIDSIGSKNKWVPELHFLKLVDFNSIDAVNQSMIKTVSLGKLAFTRRAGSPETNIIDEADCEVREAKMKQDAADIVQKRLVRQAIFRRLFCLYIGFVVPYRNGDSQAVSML